MELFTLLVILSCFMLSFHLRNILLYPSLTKVFIWSRQQQNSNDWVPNTVGYNHLVEILSMKLYIIQNLCWWWGGMQKRLIGRRGTKMLSGVMEMFAIWMTCGLYGWMPFLVKTAKTFHQRAVHFTVFKSHLNHKIHLVCKFIYCLDY